MTRRRQLLPLAVLGTLMLAPPLARAVDSPGEMLRNPAQEARAERIGRELRCLVCQNEDIEDSSADLARDLRRIVRTQVAEGRSNRAILDWMTARYGDFVRLAPPFDAGTALLWCMPVVALGIGGATAARSFRRNAHPAPPRPLEDDERTRLTTLLNQDHPLA